jgi:hypothetical protein
MPCTTVEHYSPNVHVKIAELHDHRRTERSPQRSVLLVHMSGKLYNYYTKINQRLHQRLSDNRSMCVCSPFADTVKRAAMQCAPTAASSGPTVDSPKTVTLIDVTLFTTASVAAAGGACAVRFAAVSAVPAVAVVIPLRLLSSSKLFCL